MAAARVTRNVRLTLCWPSLTVTCTEKLPVSPLRGVIESVLPFIERNVARADRRGPQEQLRIGVVGRD